MSATAVPPMGCCTLEPALAFWPPDVGLSMGVAGVDRLLRTTGKRLGNRLGRQNAAVEVAHIGRCPQVSDNHIH